MAIPFSSEACLLGSGWSEGFDREEIENRRFGLLGGLRRVWTRTIDYGVVLAVSIGGWGKVGVGDREGEEYEAASCQLGEEC